MYNMYSMAIFFFIVSVFATSELYRLISTPDLEPQTISGGLLSKFMFLIPAFYMMAYLPIKWISLIILPFLFIPINVLFRKKDHAVANMVISYFPAFYISIPFVMLFDIALMDGYYDPLPILGFFILIWVYDTGAYLSGKFFGKHKLFERISPKKTWEGLIGGALIAMLVSIFINGYFFAELSQFEWAIVALIVVVFGTLGDLIESLVKRNAGVKDSGSIMPGHGGMLDRFDSALFAAPFFWLFLQWI